MKVLPRLQLVYPSLAQLQWKQRDCSSFVVTKMLFIHFPLLPRGFVSIADQT